MQLSEAMVVHALAGSASRRLPTFQAHLVVVLWAVLRGASGERPNYTELAETLGVHRATLYRGLAALRKKGWLIESTDTVRVTQISRRSVARIELRVPPTLLADEARRA